MIEKKIGNRGSKLITCLNVPQARNKFVIIKEQRVYGSHTNNLVLRCTLMVSERNYQVKALSKIYSNQFQSAHNYSTITKTSYLEKENTNLNYPWFITGFCDAEGCSLRTHLFKKKIRWL